MYSGGKYVNYQPNYPRKPLPTVIAMSFFCHENATQDEDEKKKSYKLTILCHSTIYSH
jgi:hypothetical protein